MKTNLKSKKISFCFTLSRLRIAAAATLVVGAAGLAAASMMLPKLPWAVPTVAISDQPYSVVTGVAVDPATNTIYVASWVGGDQVEDSTIAVIDGRKCSAMNASRCTALARMSNVGPAPHWIVFDPATRTLYAENALTPDYDENNKISVLNAATCNAQNTSGCGQMPAATVTVPGPLINSDTFDLTNLALDGTTHTLYVGDAHYGPVSMINTATCNATNTGGCNQIATTGVNGDSITVDTASHSVYIINDPDPNNSQISVVDNLTCNSTNQSGCSQATTFAAPSPYYPFIAAVDSPSHTLYVPMIKEVDAIGFVGLFDVSACNGTVRSGCGATPPYLVTAGSSNFQVLMDAASRTAYSMNSGSATISMLNPATCNAQDHSRCPQTAPALATGISNNINIEINPQTHTIYAPSTDTNRAWVLDTHKCNASHAEGCTDVVPTTTVGGNSIAGVISAQSRTLYVSNQEDGTVSMIDTQVCNQRNLSGCNQVWPTIDLGGGTRFEGINNGTNTLYVANVNDGAMPGWVSVINAATCNSQNRSNCAELAQIPLGNTPQQIVIDEATNTIYVENQGSNSLSVINGAHCNASDVTACNQT